MDRSTFLKVISVELYPLLRNEGFKGSGASLRRQDGRFHHIVHVQGSTSSTECYINLGAHIDFLPAEGGGKFVSRGFNEPSCSFRRRLQSQTGEKWLYGASDSQALATVQEMISAWKTQGRAFFAQFRSSDESSNFERLIRELEAPTVHPSRALIGARIASQTGDAQRAVRIANSALERVGERATTLRAEVEEFIHMAAARQ